MYALRNHVVVSVFVVLMIATPMAAAVNGKLVANGKQFELKHAHATMVPKSDDPNHRELVVVVSDKELPPGALFDTVGRMTLGELGLTGLIVQFDGDSVDEGFVFSPAFKTAKQFATTGERHAAKFTVRTKDRVGGTISIAKHTFQEDKYEYTAKFDVPVETRDMPLKGAESGADLTEPRKAWEAYRRAIAAGDEAAIARAVSSASTLGLVIHDPDFKRSLALFQEMQPKKVKVTGGSVTGDTATLLVASLDGDNLTGTVDLQREHGHWKVANEDWHPR